MLENFTWDIPVKATGAQATPTIRLTFRPKDHNNTKTAGKYNFNINKAACSDLQLAEKTYAVAFSFDKEDELIMAIGVPNTMPSYLMRELSGGGLQFTNKRFAEKLLLHLGHSRMKQDDSGTITMPMHWREEKPENGIRIFNLIRLK